MKDAGVAGAARSEFGCRPGCGDARQSWQRDPGYRVEPGSEVDDALGIIGFERWFIPMIRASRIAAAVLACAAAGGMPGGASAGERVAVGLPSRSDIAAACAHAASISPQDVLTRTVRSGTFDIDGDGTPETVAATFAMGTMGGDAFEIRDASGQEVSWEEADVQHGDEILLGARWMPFQGRAYLLGFDDEDARFLVRLSYPGADRKLRWGCHFRTQIEETFRPVDGVATSAGICESVSAGRAEEAAVAAIVDGPEAGRWTRVDGRIEVDLDGRRTSLRRLSYSSSGGRGCDATFFDTASKTDPARSALMAMQVIEGDDSDYSPGLGGCGALSRRWLRLDGRTYLHTRYPGKEPAGGAQLVHRLDTIVAGKPQAICRSEFTAKWIMEDLQDK